MDKLEVIQAFVSDCNAEHMARAEQDTRHCVMMNMIQAVLGECNDHRDVRLADAFYDAEDEADAMWIKAQWILDAMYEAMEGGDAGT